MNPSEVQSYLNTFVNFESQLHRLGPNDFTLERIREFLDLAGNPARDLKIVHVAGTKGKGSTCVLLASILQEAGFKVGLFTSPHLHKVNERIRILDKDAIRHRDKFYGTISDQDLAATLTFLRPFAASILNAGKVLTFFEVLTVAALCYFAKSQVDIVILETGLGGRLDATNVPHSSVAIITPISLDHIKILGTTLSQIASEKAGIIKNSLQRVIIAPQEKEAQDIILERCREFGIQPTMVSLKSHEDLKVGLKGEHQKINAATAKEAAHVLKEMGFEINEAAIVEGLKQVVWPGRFEILKNNPEIVLDCAHNGASARALSRTLKENYPHRRIILLLGISQDKDVKAIGEVLKDNVSHILLTKADHPRAHLFTENEAKEYFIDRPFEIIESLPLALEMARQLAGADGVIVVTGSVFAVAEARENILCTNTKV